MCEPKNFQNQGLTDSTAVTSLILSMSSFLTSFNQSLFFSYIANSSRGHQMSYALVMHTFGYYFLVSLILIRIILLISFDSY